MKKRGFTLTEIMVALAIVAIMSAIAVPTISSISRKAGLSADSTTAESLETSIYEWMSTDYFDDTFYSGNLYTSVNAGAIGNARIGGRTEQLYSYDFAGTDQLPGTELTDVEQIRHATIVALKSTSNIRIIIKDNEQFIEGPKTASDYGFKYYYKIGRVNAEKVDATESALGNDAVYQYYVWLDRPGGNADSNTIPKNLKNEMNYISLGESFYSFSFDFGSRNISNLKVEISQAGKTSFTFEATAQTPAMFKPDVYDIRLYQNGDLVSEKLGVTLSSSASVISF